MPHLFRAKVQLPLPLYVGCWGVVLESMGVNTLLKHLAPCLEDSHVERFRGKTVAVDGNTFIFRGCYSCSEQVGRETAWCVLIVCAVRMLTTGLLLYHRYEYANGMIHRK